MPTLDIRFINTRGFISRLITGATFSLTDHCEAKNRNKDAWVGAHAFSGIEARPLNWADKDLIWCREYSIPVTEAEYEAAMAFQEAAIGTKYNYRGILGILFRKRQWNDPTRRDCSQHLFEVLLAAGQPSLNVLEEFDWMITPELLHLSPLLIGHCTYRL